MVRAKTLTGLLMLALGLQAHGAGFGRVKASAWIGQPLDVSVQVQGVDAASALPGCIKATVVQGQDALSPDRVRVKWVQREGDWWVQVRTTTPVFEPIVNVNLTLACPQTLSRSLVVFAEPPSMELPATPAADLGKAQDTPALPAWPQAIPPQAPPGTETRPARSARDPGKEARRAAPVPRVQASAPEATRQTGPAVSQAGPAKPFAKTQDRLSLSADLNERLVGDYQMSLTLASPPASAAVTERDREALREHFRALQRDPIETQRELTALQREVAALRASAASAAEQREESGSTWWWWVGLGTLAAAGLGWGAWNAHALRRERESAWWSQGSPYAAGEDEGHDEPVELEAQPSVLNTQEGGVVIRGTDASPPDQFVVGLSTELQPAREVSVEELIDLEQQAEFFIALGQHDAAIDLLVAHLRSGAGSSPLPYMKLMELYQLRGERESYDRIRARFNTRFNAHAPDWSSDLSKGRALEDYPQVIDRLQRLWPHPHLAMEVLQSSLMRTDTSAEAFDLPAYGELLMLYGVATDLATMSSAADDAVGVDIPLPLDEGMAPPPPVASFTQSMLGPLEAEKADEGEWVDSEPSVVAPTGWELEPLGEMPEAPAPATPVVPVAPTVAARAEVTTLDFHTEPMPLPGSAETAVDGFSISELPMEVMGLEVMPTEPAPAWSAPAQTAQAAPSSKPAPLEGLGSLHIDLPLDGGDKPR